MAMNQMLLLVLVSIITGVALVFAINMLRTTSVEVNRMEVRQDLYLAASNAQAIYERPVILGGASGDFIKVEDVLLRMLRIPGSLQEDGTWRNENGTYSIKEEEGGILPNQFTIIGQPASGKPDIVATVSRNQNNRRWEITFEDSD